MAVLGVVITAIITLIYAWLLRNKVIKKDKGDKDMQHVWNAISIGANSYLDPPVEDHSAGHRIADHRPVLQRLHCTPKPGSGKEFPNNTNYHCDRAATAFVMGTLF